MSPQARHGLTHKFWELTEVSKGNALPLAFNLAAQGNNQSVKAAAGLARVPALTPHELQTWRMQGFPFDKQWRWAFDATMGHGLTKAPTQVHMFTATCVLGARMKALPYNRTSPVTICKPKMYLYLVWGGGVWVCMGGGVTEFIIR